MGAGRGANQQQIREIGAGDEQQQADGPEQNKELRAQGRAHDLSGERYNSGAPAAISIRIAAVKLGGDRFHLGIRLVEGDAAA